MANKNICVYRHRRLDTNEIFYVGIGTVERSKAKDGRNIYWKRIVNKTNYEVEIIYNNLLREEACELEIFLISIYGRKNNKTGILCNMTDGGDGGIDSITKNVKRNKKWCKKISNSLTGKKLTEVHKRKLKQCKKVINILTGEIYYSIKEAHKLSNLSYTAFRAQLNGQNKNNTHFKILDNE